MKLNYATLLLAGLALFADAHAQYTPPPSGPTIRLNSTSEVFVPAQNCGYAYMEGPPWLKPGGKRSYYFSTHFSTLFSSNVNLAADNIYALNMSMNDATVVSCPLTWWNGYFHALGTTGEEGTNLQWRRNYQGVCSSHSFNIPSRGNVVVAFTHGENKNEIKWQGNIPYEYQNTILPQCVLSASDPNSYSGYDANGTYRECDKTYFGFVNLNWTDDTQENYWGNTYYREHGPIAWPSNGYLAPNGLKASVGLRHPASIVHNGYVYIYMLDSWRPLVENDPNQHPEPGREPGYRLVRAPLNSSINENAYQIYYNGSWVPSLPAGYTRQTMMNFLRTKGPKGSLILGNSNTIRFAVAKVRDMPGYFVGVEELITRVNNVEKYQVVLRLSQDLINWSAPQVILEQKDTHDQLNYRYPHFLDQWGWTNTEIDLHKFYILGTSHRSNTVSRLRLDIDILTGSGQSGCFGCKTGAGGLDSYQENDILHITAPERGIRKKVTVHNIFGTLVKQETVDQDSEIFDINLKELGAAGIYIMTVESGNNRYTKKIIVN